MPSIQSGTDLKKFELYGLIQHGLEDIRSGKHRPFSEAMTDIRNQNRSGAI